HTAGAQRKGLELVMTIDPEVPRHLGGDPGRLRQVLLNLIGNAVKFTPKGEVVLNVTLVHSEAAWHRVRFEIVDTGIGIPESVLAALFQPFVQADTSTTRRFGGTGLGLAICKRLVDLMGGEIGVASQPGAGSKFWFTVDLKSASEPLSDSFPPPSPRHFEHHRALIVDDNAASRKWLAQLCSLWHLPHESAASSAEALVKLRQAAAGRPFTLAIVDQHMPGMDGLGLVAAIQADSSLARLAIMLLTSRGEPPSQAQLETFSVASCETKPVRTERLGAALDRLLATVPVAVVAPALTEPIGASSSSRDKPRILIAEDNRVNQKVTLHQLRNLGYSADVVADGQQVLAALQVKNYALVLMDQQMPVMDGLEATRRIREAQGRKAPGFPSTLRIVAMTANAMAGDREVCLGAGMDDYLAKPVRPDALREMLARYIGPEEDPMKTGAAA
ncbi:MAG: response regulator, partial [Opitutaceae bacterium]